LLLPHAFARLPLGSRFLPLRGNRKDCCAGYKLRREKQTFSHVRTVFTQNSVASVTLLCHAIALYHVTCVMSKDADVEIPSPILNCPPTESNTEPAPTERSTGNPTPSNQTDPGPQAIRPASPAECHKSSAVTRSGRSIRPPSYLKDYV